MPAVYRCLCSIDYE